MPRAETWEGYFSPGTAQPHIVNRLRLRTWFFPRTGTVHHEEERYPQAQPADPAPGSASTSCCCSAGRMPLRSHCLGSSAVCLHQRASCPTSTACAGCVRRGGFVPGPVGILPCNRRCRVRCWTGRGHGAGGAQVAEASYSKRPADPIKRQAGTRTYTQRTRWGMAAAPSQVIAGLYIAPSPRLGLPSPSQVRNPPATETFREIASPAPRPSPSSLLACISTASCSQGTPRLPACLIQSHHS